MSVCTGGIGGGGGGGVSCLCVCVCVHTLDQRMQQQRHGCPLT